MSARTWTVIDYLLVFSAVGCAAVILAIGIVIAWRALRGDPHPDKLPLKRR
jgi:hypothetical protein